MIEKDLPRDPGDEASRNRSPARESYRWSDVGREGPVAGLIGYAAVVVVIGAIDILQGRGLFYTPSLLGARLFLGGGDPVVPEVDGGAVMAYNGFHLLGSLAMGFVGAFTIAATERLYSFWYIALMILIASGLYTVAVLGGIGAEMIQAVGWVTVVIGTTAWFGGMTVYFWSAHPRLLGSLDHDPDAAG